MAGLPGAGKSTVARGLARALSVPALSVDPIEAAMWRAGVARDQPTGIAAYVVAEAVAAGLLELGQDVVVDAVNAVDPARGQWRELAGRFGVPVAFIEVACSDRDTHRRRLEGRVRDIEGFPEPTWETVRQVARGFDAWAEQDRVLVLDSMDEAEANLVKAVGFVDSLRRGRASRSEPGGRTLIADR